MGKKKAPEEQRTRKTSRHHRGLFPVVAIGASAGGLQALNELLDKLPDDLGMAYVVIQHLSPKHESILPELLASKTRMPVHTVHNGMHIETDQIYVIPPNTFMSIVDGSLTLSERIKTNSTYHSIDFFLHALAPVYQSKAIAVILSGTGSDGTLGIQSVKANGGITFAQDESAAFIGMPKTASDSGFTDFVMPCHRIAQELTSIARNPDGLLSLNEVAEAHETEIKQIQVLLHNKKNVDFGYYKQTTVNRRIMRRMALNKFRSLREYTKYLRENPEELDLLYKDLLINVTSFFRDPAVYQALIKKIFPDLFKGRKPNDMIRIWTPACANGEEAYSLAICLFDYLKDKAISTPIQIFGTDLNETAIDKARVGIYNKSVMENISPQRLKKYFLKTDGQYQIIKAIRDVCIFATHNLLKDPPFSRMDLISCQNVLIYLETNPQRKILQAFHYALKPTGFLLLGKSETIGNSTELFSQVDKDLKVYAKKYAPPGTGAFDFSLKPTQLPGSTDEHVVEGMTDINIEKEIDRILLSRYVPASVLVNKDLQILRFHGATSNYLQPSAGKASLHLLKMVKDDLVFELKGLINRAKNEGAAVKKEGVQYSMNSHEREITLEVVPVKSPVKDFYYLILFKETNASMSSTAVTDTPSKKTRDQRNERIVKLEQQLIEAREYMRTMSEEFEATREELQSANEEVLSANEELQSINEELETSKEELQSTNEELITINEELQQRNNELRDVTEYLQAIVETINEPLLVLNSDLRVTTANRAYYSLFRTNADRVEGNNFFEIDNQQWNIPDLRKKLVETILRGKSMENYEIFQKFHLIGEKFLVLNALRMEQEDNKRNRILVVIQDITERSKAIRDLSEREERFRLLLQNTFDIITIYEADGSIMYMSEGIDKSLGFDSDSLVHKNIFDLGIVHPDDVSKKRALFQEATQNPGKNIKGQLRLQHKKGSYRVMEVILRNLLKNESIKGIIANYQDVTDQVR